MNLSWKKSSLKKQSQNLTLLENSLPSVRFVEALESERGGCVWRSQPSVFTLKPCSTKVSRML